jgi:hypothetical protein
VKDPDEVLAVLPVPAVRCAVDKCAPVVAAQGPPINVLEVPV